MNTGNHLGHLSHFLKTILFLFGFTVMFLSTGDSFIKANTTEAETTFYVY